MKINGMGWAMVVCLFAERREDLQEWWMNFYSLCTRRKRKVNAGRIEMMIFERREIEMVDFNTSYRVSVPAVGRCDVQCFLQFCKV